MNDETSPAFPAPDASREHFGSPSAYMGLTKREYFAAAAMAASICSPYWAQESHEDRAQFACGQADELLKALAS